MQTIVESEHAFFVWCTFGALVAESAVVRVHSCPSLGPGNGFRLVWMGELQVGHFFASPPLVRVLILPVGGCREERQSSIPGSLGVPNPATAGGVAVSSSSPAAEELVLDSELVKRFSYGLIYDFPDGLRLVVERRHWRENNSAHLGNSYHVTEVPKV